MKKVAIFLGDIQGTGGISRVTWIISNNLKDYFDISILSSYRNPVIKYEYSKDISVSYLFNDQKPIHTRFLALSKKIRQFVKANKIEMLICAGAIYFPPCVFALIGLDIKLICWEHSNVSVENEHKFQKICRRIGAMNADEVVTLTKTDSDMYREKYKISNCRYIYNPIDDRLVTDVTYRGDSKRIISVGRLCYQKNFGELIEVAKIVLRKHPEWAWDIFGDGEERKELQDRIINNHLEGQLKLVGNDPDLYTKYKDYSFLVMTSRFEGFPMTLLESTAQGIPAVAYDVLTGPNEIIVDGVSGYLVKKDDREMMIRRIETLMEDTELRKRMSQNCLKERERFQCKSIINQWVNLLNEL